MTSPSASTGPVIEWREREDGDFDAYVNDLSMGFISPGVKRFRMFFGDADEQTFHTLDAARTACEAAILGWFKRAGWPQAPELTDDMVMRAMAYVPGCDHDDMVSALEAALGLPITDTRDAS